MNDAQATGRLLIIYGPEPARDQARMPFTGWGGQFAGRGHGKRGQVSNDAFRISVAVGAIARTTPRVRPGDQSVSARPAGAGSR
jgi:uracil-DNA glycosylase